MLDTDEIAWIVREYGEPARLTADGGADVIELHANHDDVLRFRSSSRLARRGRC